jgi:hypothetical protein
MKTNRAGTGRNRERRASFLGKAASREPNYRQCSIEADTNPPSEGLTGIVRRTRWTGPSARSAERAEVAFVKKRHEEWWECRNQVCGAQILFLMLGAAPNRAGPTCFCGSTMQPVARTRRRRYRSDEVCCPDTNDAREREGTLGDHGAGKVASKARASAARNGAAAMPRWITAAPADATGAQRE